MIDEIGIRQELESKFPALIDEIMVIDNSGMIDIRNVMSGIFIVYASWSGPAIINYKHAIEVLRKQHYSGQIIVVDIDCMTPDFQVELLGEFCHGWGEAFLIQNGMISGKYLMPNTQ